MTDEPSTRNPKCTDWVALLPRKQITLDSTNGSKKTKHKTNQTNPWLKCDSVEYKVQGYLTTRP